MPFRHRCCNQIKIFRFQVEYCLTESVSQGGKKMHAPVIIEVKIRKTDIWPISSAQILKNNAFKVVLVYTLIFLLVSIFLKIVSLTSAYLNGSDFISLYVMTAFCFFFFILFPFGINYFTFKRQLYTDKVFSTHSCYKFSNEDVHISSNYGNNVIQWNEIDKISETKPSFFIHFSKCKLIILPRRCFSDQTQLEQFRVLLQTCIPADKLHLGQFRVGQTSTEIVNDTSEQVQEKLVEPAPNFSVLKLKFQFNRDEIIYFSLRRYYTRPFGIIMTLIGIYLLFDFSRQLAAGIGDSYVLILNVVFLGFQLILGLMFLFLIPFIVYLSANKGKRTNRSFHGERIYQFGEETFSIEIGTDKTVFRWNDLAKISENRKGFILNIPPIRSYYLPKRVFENAEETARFDDLIKRHVNHSKNPSQ